MLTGVVAFAQKNIPQQGSWVVESNIYIPKLCTVKFYNGNQELIYEEEIKGKKINIDRKKVKKALDKALMFAINKEQVITEKNLVIAELKR